MNDALNCPACQQAITVKQLFWTATLLRFKCPHGAAPLQPTDKAFATRWLLLSGVAGAVLGVAAGMGLDRARDGAARGLIFAGVALLLIGSIGVIKWRASVALIRKGQLKVRG